MKKLILCIMTIFILSLQPAFNQQAYKLIVKQPPALTITISDTINASTGDIVNLDTWFHVEGTVSYSRTWKFWDGSKLQTVDDPVYTIASKGVFYLALINEYGCSVLDSVILNLVTGIEEISSDENNPQSICVYPNPNTGTFDIFISDCKPGFSVDIINSLGVLFINKPLGCNNNQYSGKIQMPSGESGTYYLLVKKDNKIIFRQKVILLK